jgi:hypothetical protein
LAFLIFSLVSQSRSRKKGKELEKPATDKEQDKGNAICYGKARKQGRAPLDRGEKTKEKIRRARPGGEE